MPSRSWTLPEELRLLAESGEAELVREVVAVFQTDTAERLAQLRAAVDAGDRAVIRSQAHSIKGGAGQVGAMKVADVCQSLETRAATGSTSELQNLLRQLESAFADVVRDMTA